MLKFFARLQLLNVFEPHRLACKSFRFLCEAADLGFVNWVSRVCELNWKPDMIFYQVTTSLLSSQKLDAPLKAKGEVKMKVKLRFLAPSAGIAEIATR